MLPPLIEGKLVRPINHDYIPNLTNIWPTLQDPWYDPGAVYTIGSVLGAFGIGWRTDLIDIDVANLANPWDALWDPAAKGIVAFQDQFREAIAFSLFHDGVKDPNNPSDDELSAAVDGLKSLVNNNGARIGTDVSYVGLGEGHVWDHAVVRGGLAVRGVLHAEGRGPSVSSTSGHPQRRKGR